MYVFKPIQTLLVHIAIDMANDQRIGYICNGCIFMNVFVFERDKHRGRRVDACLFKQEPHDHLARNVLCFSNGSQPSHLSSTALQIRD